MISLGESIPYRPLLSVSVQDTRVLGRAKQTPPSSRHLWWACDPELTNQSTTHLGCGVVFRDGHVMSGQ